MAEGGATISWDWAEAGRGALCALPAAVIIPAVNVTLGMVFAIATLPVAMLGVPALLLPGFALGMNHPAPDGFVVAAVMLAGCAWATLVTCCWPRTHPPAISAVPPDPEPDPAAARRAACLYAAMFAAAAGLLLHSGPAEIALAVITIAAIAAMIAVRTSRWYVSSAGSGLIVLLISGISGTREFDISFAERLLETALGAGLALTFGVAIPAGLRWLTRKHAATDPAPQARP